MTKEQEDHLELLKLNFVSTVDKKYRKGQAEHGGNLINMPVLELIDSAIEEAVDQFVYLTTLRNKLATTKGEQNK